MVKILLIAIIFIILSTPIFALTNSTIYCLDNVTLVENITVYKDGNESTLMMPVHCDYGCDNTTNVCNPSTSYQNLYILIIIIIIVVGTIAFIKWVGK